MLTLHQRTHECLLCEFWPFFVGLMSVELTLWTLCCQAYILTLHCWPYIVDFTLSNLWMSTLRWLTHECFFCDCWLYTVDLTLSILHCQLNVDDIMLAILRWRPHECQPYFILTLLTSVDFVIVDLKLSTSWSVVLTLWILCCGPYVVDLMLSTLGWGP